MAEAAIIGQKPMDGFIREGFKGMRRHAINQFAKRFFITEDNPNGTIDPFPEDMDKEKLDAMMELYHQQGKFGDDPFNQHPKDEMAELKKKLEELQAMMAGPRANPENESYKPPVVAPVSIAAVPGGEDGPQYAALEDMPWRDLVAKAKAMGLKPYQKTRTVLISEIEAKEAE